MSLRALAAAAGIANHQTVAFLERGDHEPSLGQIEKLADALAVEPGWLAFGEKE